MQKVVEEEHSVNVSERTLFELIFHVNETQKPRMWGADDVWLENTDKSKEFWQSNF